MSLEVEPAATELAPCSVSDPPGSVTLFMPPFDTVSVPFGLADTVRPLPLKMAELTTPLEIDTGV